MTCRGKIRGGVVILDNPTLLPEGTTVEVRPVEEGNTLQTADEQELLELRQTLLGWAGKAKGLPADMARNHDHYLHGRPKSDRDFCGYLLFSCPDQRKRHGA